MERDFSAVYLPQDLVKRLDTIAHDEMRSRANTTRWLLEQALRDREPAEVAEAGAEGAAR